MKTTNPEQTPSHRRIPSWLIILILAAIPSGYFYLTGRLARTHLQKEVDGLVLKAETLADSLDGMKTHLILGAALASVRAGDYQKGRTSTSDFFARVDRRTRNPGMDAGELATRLEILSSRDDAISALSQESTEATRILERLAVLHLTLVAPELAARSPMPGARPGSRDTLR